MSREHFCSASRYSTPTRRPLDMRRQALAVSSLLGLLLLTSTADAHHQSIVEGERMDSGQMLRQHGYEAEEHFAITEDGYVLRMFRIPSRRPELGLPPVMLQHGLLCSSDDWVMNGPGSALAYLMADAGYETWLGNARGNVYSRNHILMSTKNSKFWKFSWHEQGVSDLPAMIDHILHVSGHQKLFYVGHSMGTTMFFVMASERPEYNEKVLASFLLAPVGYMRYISSKFLKLLAQVEAPVMKMLEFLGFEEFEPSNELTKKLTDVACAEGSMMQDVCSNVIFHIAGYNAKETNETMLPVYLAHTPAGASVRQLDHYGQEIRSGGPFRKYDFGPSENRKRYGRRHPPDYRLSAVTAPVAFFYGANDCLAHEHDVRKAYKQMVNPIGIFRAEMDEWAHLDFIWGIHGKELVYDKIFQLMQTFLNKPNKNKNFNTDDVPIMT